MTKTHTISPSELEAVLPRLDFDKEGVGGALTVFKEGSCIIDTAFGRANRAHNWTPHTLSVNFSIGKGVIASLVAVLVSKGILDYHVPISHYWADFGVAGKERITVLDVLTHRAGLYRIASVMSDNSQVSGWAGMVKKVAAMPISTPYGQQTHQYASAYSALVSGWVLGGLIEQATNQRLQAVLDTHLAKPLGVTGELFFGLPGEYYPSLALPKRSWEQDTPRRKPVLKPDSDTAKALFSSLPISPLWKQKTDMLTTQSVNQQYFDPSLLNLRNYKEALLADGKTPIDYHCIQNVSIPIPAANGVSSSHALATLYAMHANDGVWQGQLLIDPDTLRTMRDVYVFGTDAVMPAQMNWRAGFHRLFTLQSAPNAYGHMGYNGSVAFCDPDRRLSVAFIHNFDTTMLNDIRQFVVSEMALQLAR